MNCICGDPACQIPYGLCHCGCGEKTNIAKSNSRRSGAVKGKPQRFYPNHHGPEMKPRKPLQGRPEIVQPEDQSFRLIPLTQGQTASVSTHRYQHLSQWAWFARKLPNNRGYAAARVGKRDGKTVVVMMHAYIVHPQPGFVADHINGNSLDNRDENLREITQRLNSKNIRAASANSTGIRGVLFYKWNAMYLSTIVDNDGKVIHLGYSERLNEAVAKYVEAAKRIHGDYFRKEEYSQIMNQIEDRKGREWSTAALESIYKAYPRHVGKAHAIRQIRVALDRICDGEIDGKPRDQESAITFLRASSEHAKALFSGRDPKYIPWPSTYFFQGRYLPTNPQPLPANLEDAISILACYPTITEVDIDAHMPILRVIDAHCEYLKPTHGAAAASYIRTRVLRFAECVNRWPEGEMQFIPGADKFFRERRYDQDERLWNRVQRNGFEAERDQLSRLLQ